MENNPAIPEHLVRLMPRVTFEHGEWGICPNCNGLKGGVVNNGREPATCLSCHGLGWRWLFACEIKRTYFPVK